jgi:hypothetical protein
MKGSLSIEGILALRSIERSMPDFRMIVTLIVASIALVFGVATMSLQAENFVSSIYSDIEDVEADMVIGFYKPFVSEHNLVEYQQIEEDLTDVLREIPDVKILGIGRSPYDHFLEVDENIFGGIECGRNLEYFGLRGDALIPVNLVSVDARHHAQLAQKAGVPESSNILLSYYYPAWGDGENVSELAIQRVLPDGTSSKIDIPVQGKIVGEEIPNEILLYTSIRNTFVLEHAGAYLIILMPVIDSAYMTYFVDTEDEEAFIDHATSIVSAREGFSQTGTTVARLSYAQDALSAGGTIFITLTYGFAGLLIFLLAVNTVSVVRANIKSYARDVAILNSIGMEKKRRQHVLNLIVFFGLIIALAAGIPLGILTSLIVYLALPANFALSYTFPWIIIVQATIILSAMALILMYLSKRSLEDVRPAETIRHLQ